MKITRFDPNSDLIIVPGRIWGPRGAGPRLNMVLDTGSAETVIVPEVLDELGYSARSADRITVMRSAVGREEGYLIHVERFGCEDRYDGAVELYTPVGPAEAARLDRGEGFGDLTYYFVDKPDPGEAADGAIWVMIEMPEEEALPFEHASPPELGYREFALPGRVATRFPVRRHRSS